MANNSKLAVNNRAVGLIVVSTGRLLALLPGVAIFMKGLWAPPGQERAFGTAITVLSLILVLQLMLYRRSFERMERRRIIRITGVLAVLGLTGLAAFRAVYVSTVYEVMRPAVSGSASDSTRVAKADTALVFVPLFWSKELKASAQADRGMIRAIEKNEGGMRREIRNIPLQQWLTEGIVLTSYLTMALSLVAILVILGWRVGASEIEAERESEAARGGTSASLRSPVLAGSGHSFDRSDVVVDRASVR